VEHLLGGLRGVGEVLPIGAENGAAYRLVRRARPAVVNHSPPVTFADCVGEVPAIGAEDHRLDPHDGPHRRLEDGRVERPDRLVDGLDLAVHLDSPPPFRLVHICEPPAVLAHGYHAEGNLSLGVGHPPFGNHSTIEAARREHAGPSERGSGDGTKKYKKPLDICSNHSPCLLSRLFSGRFILIGNMMM
jgi:hypothetical protein